ncbi:hypothetical protein Tco_1421475, partial [Tanacetum coccineum]
MKRKVEQYSRQIESLGLERRYVFKDCLRMLDNEVPDIIKRTKTNKSEHENGKRTKIRGQ